MKFIVFAASLAVAAAVPYGGVVNTGSSSVQRSDDGHGNYAFGYNEDHATGGTFRKEQGGPGYMSGSYGLRDIDGRVRTVNYVADALGYRATVSTNEPGTDVKQDPAAVNLNNGVYGAAPAVLAAPVAAYTAPIVAKAYGPVAAYAASPVLASYSSAINHASYGPAVLSTPILSGKVGYGGYGYNTFNKAY